MIDLIREKYPIHKPTFTAVLRRVARELGLRGQISIRLAAPAESRELNRTYRGKDYATDVLSFPQHERLPDGYHVGDILVCFDIAVAQAAEQGHSVERELLELMVHGLLHLAGFDHETDQGEMLARQRELMTAFAGEFA